MKDRRLLAPVLWLLLAALAALVAVRARYTADLSAFLPTAPTAAQRFLVEQLRDGLASRLILVDIEGADAATRAALSRALATRLRTQPAFRSVLNGETGGFEHDRTLVFSYRYLLSDQVGSERFGAAGLQAAIADGVDLLASPAGLAFKELFTRDPTGETLQVMAQLEQGSPRPNSVEGIWASRDGRRALLLAQTSASGADSEAQSQAVSLVRDAFAAAQRETGGAARQTLLQLTGPGVFAAEARATIEQEATRLALLSAVMIMVLLWLVYRSLPLLLLGLLPVVSGALAGVAAVALGFGVVHGITLGFGVTLIGEAVDYSIYLFMQSRRAGDASWTRTLWPTMRLGLLTSVCGFASLLPSGFPGLAQLGLYSITGLVVAGLTTRYVLPPLMRSGDKLANVAPLGRRLSEVLARSSVLRPLLWLIPPLAAVVLLVHRDQLWSRDLAALSPVPAAAQQLDGELRGDLGAPDTRSIIVLAGADQQAVLRAAETYGAALEPLVARNVIAGYQTPSRYLPSIATQQARQAALPTAAELQQRLAAAARELPVRIERLQPFIADVVQARDAPPLRREDLAGTSLGDGLDALLVLQDGRWNALLPLQAPVTADGSGSVDIAAVENAVRSLQAPGVEAAVLDLKRESDALYAGYLTEALRLSLAGFVAIVILLAVALRGVKRTVRVIAPLLLAVLCVLLGFALTGRLLNILHLIGLLLVIALGSNYALFFARTPAAGEGSDEHAHRMLASLLVANLTTVLAFGVLAWSTVPVLSALGTTVAPGAMLALLFSALLAEPAKPAARGDAAGAAQ